jgi:hypothetical protein
VVAAAGEAVAQSEHTYLLSGQGASAAGIAIESMVAAVVVAGWRVWFFVHLAFLPLRGVNLIVRAKYANALDWRQGQRLGKNDRLVTDLVRRLVLESSLPLVTPIERQSFKGTADTLRAWRETLAAPSHASQREYVLLDMLLLCALDQLPHRPVDTSPEPSEDAPKPTNFSPVTDALSRNLHHVKIKENLGQNQNATPPFYPLN